MDAPHAARRCLMTVTGPLPASDAGITDAHNHVWISPVDEAAGGPVLNTESAILSELVAYRQAGGGTLIDCQPGGCGRDGRQLQTLGEASGVHIVACTGFHLRRYYPPDYALFDADPHSACELFITELRDHLAETNGSATPVCAGFIKIACEATLEGSPVHLIEAAVGASLATGAGIEVHTEQGADADRIARAMLDFGLPPGKLVLCHVDKRPDLALHRELAQQGILLEYDTFYRPKYDPERHLWPLLENMIEAGLTQHVAIATDMADAAMWSTLGNGPGLTGLFTQIIPRLHLLGCDAATVRQLTGENIVGRLARPC